VSSLSSWQFTLSLTLGIIARAFLAKYIKLPYTVSQRTQSVQDSTKSVSDTERVCPQVILLILGLVLGLIEGKHRDGHTSDLLASSFSHWTTISPETVRFCRIPASRCRRWGV
jgi:hypothetical protein